MGSYFYGPYYRPLQTKRQNYYKELQINESKNSQEEKVVQEIINSGFK